MSTMSSNRSVIDILSDLLAQFTTLVSKETRLARVEMSERISHVASGVAFLVGGAVLLIPALVILLDAAVAALDQTGLGQPWSSLIVGGAVLIIGFILLMVGIGRFKAEHLVPERTIHQIQEDAEVAKRQMRTDNDYQRAA
jgi:uncharacterized membrane protein YqjE